MKKVFLYIIPLFLVANVLQAQEVEPNIKYWIYLNDKAANEFTTNTPSEFLSDRAIDRRERYNIAITEQDLPISGSYINLLKTYPITILNSSKWFNAVAISVDSSDLAAIGQISNESFVKNIEVLARYNFAGKKGIDKFELETIESTSHTVTGNFYGHSQFQIEQCNAHHLHGNGFMGEGMHVAVLDAGFTGVEENPYFQHLYNENRLLGVYDFVDNDSDPYHGSSHGSSVLSTMAAYEETSYVGTAPKASYWLMRTEDVGSEQRIEEINWIAAAEKADSAGVDVINTSLGYSNFDSEEFNYTYDDMNGNVALITQGADIAAAKGMLIINSAGNSGNSDWKYITAPADGDSVLTIGAVNYSGTKVGFSSFGPTADGQLKPDVMALGQLASIVRTDGTLGTSNGTSFSSPILAGMATCLWQNNLEYKNTDIMEALRLSASLNSSPNDSMGWGIPDLKAAYFILKGTELEDSDDLLSSTSNLNQTDNLKGGWFTSLKSRNTNFKIYDLASAEIFNYTQFLQKEEMINVKSLVDKQDIVSGIYIIKIKQGEQVFSGKLYLE